MAEKQPRLSRNAGKAVGRPVKKPNHQLAAELAAELRKRILRGEYAQGRLPTLRELESGGEALDTKLRASRHVGRLALAILINEGLIEAKGKAGTFVRQRDARRDRSLRAGLIAVVAPSSRYEFINKALDGIIATLDDINSAAKLPRQVYRAVRVSSDGNRQKEEQLLRALNEEVDGIILLPVNTTDRDDDSKAAFGACTVPLVLIGRDIAGIDVPGRRILYPERLIGRTIAQFVGGKLAGVEEHVHLVIAGERANSSLRNRSNETVQALEEQLGQNQARSIREKLSLESRERAGEEVVEALCGEQLIGPSADARTWIICMTDLIALGVMHALRTKEGFSPDAKRIERGYSVPRDVWVMGVDGDSWGEYVYPSLTTVELRPEEIGKIAARVMIDTIEKRSETIAPVLTVDKGLGELRKRESTGDRCVNKIPK